MSNKKSTKKVREKIVAKYGNEDMFTKYQIPERIDAENVSTNKFKEFRNQYKMCHPNEADEQLNELTYHHMQHENGGEEGRATVENGALISTIAHKYIHLLDRYTEEQINNMIRQGKRIDDIYKKEFEGGISIE